MNEAEQSLLDSLEAEFFRLGSFNPEDFLSETVYHYTSAGGLYGIVSSGTLWGSNYSYLNDTSEITYGRELVHEVVHERVEAEGDPVKSSFLSRIYDRLAPTPLEATDFYLTCFCQTPDRLSQWRGYGGQSGRYCIGFNLGSLLNAARIAHPSANGPVHYDRDRQRSRVASVIDRACTVLLQGRADHEPFRSAIEATLLRKLLQDLCFFKDLAFEQEDEFRIVHFAPNAASLHFRAAGGLLLPFIDMLAATTDPPVLPITEVIIGSSRMESLAIKAATLLLDRHAYRNVAVRQSSVPFREL